MIDFQDCVSSDKFYFLKQVLYIHCVKSSIFNESNVVEHSRSEFWMANSKEEVSVMMKNADDDDDLCQ